MYATELVESFEGEKWLTQIRRDAISILEQVQFPTGQQEKWRYSPIHKLRLEEYEPISSKPQNFQPRREGIFSSSPNSITLTDGYLSDLPQTDEYSVTRISHMKKPFDLETDREFFSQLNLALCPDPVVIQIPHNYLHTDGAMTFPKLHIEIAPGAEVSIVEILHENDLKCLSIPETKINVGNGANVKYQQIQNTGLNNWLIGNLDVRVGQQATFNGATIGIGGAYARMETHCRLQGRGATGNISAIYHGVGDQILDYRTYQEHVGRDTQSNLLFKGVLDDEASSIYTGMIRVHQEAAGTNAFQTNRTLKLSEQTWAESVPNLEIENNDVRCSHASTVSPVDHNQRFYLESRGIPETVVDRLIVRGFLNEVVQKLPIDEVNAWISSLLSQKQNQESHDG